MGPWGGVVAALRTCLAQGLPRDCHAERRDLSSVFCRYQAARRPRSTVCARRQQPGSSHLCRSSGTMLTSPARLEMGERTNRRSTVQLEAAAAWHTESIQLQLAGLLGCLWGRARLSSAAGPALNSPALAAVSERTAGPHRLAGPCLGQPLPLGWLPHRPQIAPGCLRV